MFKQRAIPLNQSNALLGPECFQPQLRDSSRYLGLAILPEQWLLFRQLLFLTAGQLQAIAARKHLTNTYSELRHRLLVDIEAIGRKVSRHQADLGVWQRRC